MQTTGDYIGRAGMVYGESLYAYKSNKYYKVHCSNIEIQHFTVNIQI